MPTPTFTPWSLHTLALTAALLGMGLPLRPGQPQSKPRGSLLDDGKPHASQGTRTEKNGQIIVNRHVLRPWARLANVDFAGTDLHGANLRHADLSGANLRGVDLRWADLSYANLQLAHLEGARLDGARLFMAKVFALDGADYTLAHLHPFFDETLPEAEGAIRLFMVTAPEEAPEPIRSPVTGPGGNVYWLRGAEGRFTCLATTGAAFAQNAESRFYDPRAFALGIDTDQVLMIFGERHLHGFPLKVHELGAASKDRIRIGATPSGLAPPTAMIPSPWGTQILLWPDTVGEIRWIGGQLEIKPWNRFPGIAPRKLVFNPRTHAVYFIHEADRALLVNQLGPGGATGNLTGTRLVSEHLPDLLAVGADNRVWAATRGRSELFSYLSPGAQGAQDPIQVRLPVGTDLYQIVSGPDGNLWATAPQANLIFRITPTGAVTSFELPPGVHPTELVNHQHGKLLFTSLRGDRIGTIRAIASQGAAEPEDWFPEPAAAQPASAPQDPADLEPLQERTEAHLAQLEAEEAEEAEEAVAPAAASAAAAPSRPLRPAPTRAATAATSSRESQAQGSGPVPAALRLNARGVILTPGATRHILAGHRHGLDLDKSAFAATFSSPEALGDLLAMGLLEAQQTGLFGRIRMWDHHERSYTVCHMAQPVGTYRRHGQAVATNTFVVVTSEFLDRPTRRRVHGVVTAYPVSPDF